MKVFASIFLLAFFVSPHAVFPQSTMISPKTSAGAPSNNVKLDEQLKADIWEDLKALPNKNRSQYYAQLAEIYWQKEQAEGKIWLNNAIDNALSPATDYRNAIEKIEFLMPLIFSFGVFEKDAALGQKLLGALKETISDEVKNKGSDELNGKLIYLADNIFKFDENLALEFAALSLKGEKPVINGNTITFFRRLNSKNTALSNIFFKSLTELVKNRGDHALLDALMKINDPPLNSWELQPDLSDAQKTELLEVLIPYIQKDSVELAAKKRTDCGFVSRYGTKYIEDYNKLLPSRAPIIDQAITACKAADIEPWKKPGYFKDRPFKTSQDIVDFAKQLTDKRLQTQWLYSAALRAETEKNYRFAIDILDGIEPAARQSLWEWQIIRAQVAGKLVTELLQNDNIDEANMIIDKAPPEIRPSVIRRVLYDRMIFKNKDKLKFELLSRMRKELENLDSYSNERMAINRFDPDDFFKVAREYHFLRQPDEALSVLETYVRLQNQISRRFPEDNNSREYFGFSFAPVFVGGFAEQNAQRIYRIIGAIESVRPRLKLRCMMLAETVNRSMYVLPYVPPQTNSN